MDIQPQTIKPISDDQELAKVLAGITQQPNNLGYEESPMPGQFSQPTAATAPEPEQDEPATMPTPSMDMPPIDSTQPIGPTNELESIKKEALMELRPLVGKLDLEAEEKFNIYLLLIRSTDDKSLIAPAHEAAANIADESKKAQALLDIIKEIDFLSTPA